LFATTYISPQPASVDVPIVRIVKDSASVDRVSPPLRVVAVWHLAEQLAEMIGYTSVMKLTAPPASPPGELPEEEDDAIIDVDADVDPEDEEGPTMLDVVPVDDASAVDEDIDEPDDELATDSTQLRTHWTSAAGSGVPRGICESNGGGDMSFV
jgi:hypothetical protein